MGLAYFVISRITLHRCNGTMPIGVDLPLAILRGCVTCGLVYGHMWRPTILLAVTLTGHLYKYLIRNFLSWGRHTACFEHERFCYVSRWKLFVSLLLELWRLIFVIPEFSLSPLRRLEHTFITHEVFEIEAEAFSVGGDLLIETLVGIEGGTQVTLHVLWLFTLSLTTHLL